VTVMGDMYLLIYAASAVAAAVFLADPGSSTAGWVPGLRWIAPVSFVVASEFVYWSGWHELRIALPLVLGGLLLFLLMRRGRTSGRTGEEREEPLWAELRAGSWLLVYLAGLTALSWLGSFEGTSRLPAPWDTAVVAAVSLGLFFWAVRAGVAHRTSKREATGAPAESPS
jgi:hypothetical protein